MTKQKTTKERKVKAWKWKIIRKAINEVYDAYHHTDDWGLEVVYRESMLQRLREKLNKLPKSKTK